MVQLLKQEVPISRQNGFYPPIHPKLTLQDTNIDRDLARNVFSQAAKEWHLDLQEYTDKLEDPKLKEWLQQVFLRKKPKVNNRHGRLELNILGWEANINCGKNGLAEVLSISRNAGGSLYCSSEFYRTYAIIDDPRGGMPKEKAVEMSIDGKIVQIGEHQGVRIYTYNQHNVDHYPGALFLRNWVVLYLNEAMKGI